jgi:hypothetical protein
MTLRIKCMCDDQRNPPMAAPSGRFSTYRDLASHTGAKFGHARAVFS